ncbi:MAG: TrbG/VirB9 family P-type conjugative transfer protein [Anaerovibrio sp.]|nr:TrbG/VirB9 family P-type conjugative transfer protein [Anaerovibrio sp.]
MNAQNIRKNIAAFSMLGFLMLPIAASAQTVTDDTSIRQEQTTSADKQEINESHKERKLREQVQKLEAELEEKAREHLELLAEVDELSSRQKAIERGDSLSHGYPATSNYLVEPGYNENVGYTQDAINAQGDSTMVFSYSPSQLYKIYCKLNYLTDIVLKEGEQITYVGGGDTGKWMLDASTVEGTPHIYLKPIAKGAKTNIIINTTHHTYQVLCSEGDWYNPIIKWSYGSENIMKSIASQKALDRTVSGVVQSPENLSFDYRIRGEASWKPEHVFDDGRKTYIRFSKSFKKLPVLFVKEKGHKEAMLVNYHVKANTLVVERTFYEAELRMDGEKVRITKK